MTAPSNRQVRLRCAALGLSRAPWLQISDLESSTHLDHVLDWLSNRSSPNFVQNRTARESPPQNLGSIKSPRVRGDYRKTYLGLSCHPKHIIPQGIFPSNTFIGGINTIVILLVNIHKPPVDPLVYGYGAQP